MEGSEAEAKAKIQPKHVHFADGDCDLDGVAAKMSHEQSILRFFGDLKKSNIVFFTGVPRLLLFMCRDSITNKWRKPVSRSCSRAFLDWSFY